MVGKELMERAYSYDEVFMYCKYNNVPSRSEPSVKTWLTKNIEMDIPVLAANMDTVINEPLADVLLVAGSIPIFHRFYKNTDELVRLVQKFDRKCFMSVGVADLYDIFKLIDTNNLNPIGLCVDVAHGHSMTALDAIGQIRKIYYQFEVIAGNVCTPIGYYDLVNAGATAVKVGIGPGSVCTTRKVTAFGTPQFTAVQQCGIVARELKVPMIADGGIKGSRELALALAAGASSVMVGGIFSESTEARATNKGIYRGQASQSFQDDFYGKVKEGTVPEGIRKVIKGSTTAQEVIDELIGGLRSNMTYGGSRSIKEFQRKAQFGIRRPE